MPVFDRPSPNHDERDGPIDMLILHYTGMTSAGAALDRLCDPVARVSSHYLIDEDGTVWRLVPEERRAFHAGISSWGARNAVNGVSIGIELVNPGHEWGYRAFPEAQMAALERLGGEILARHPIPPRRVLGHSDVAPARKQDPGELFDWPRLARAGLGFWPDFTRPPAAIPEGIAAVQRSAAAIGYGCPESGTLDTPTRQVLTAFQRHFRPRLCDGEPDRETRERLATLVQGI